MGRILGYMARSASPWSQALEGEPLEATLVSLSTVPYGWGVGFYHGDEILHIKRPHTEDIEFDWRSIAKDIVSDCIIAHVREPSVGSFRTENTHPFRMRQWLFAHSGAISGFADLRSKLIASLPDFMQRNVRGDTDSEVFFHMILAELFATGQLEMPDPDPLSVIGAIRTAVQSLSDTGAPAASHILNIVLTNGRMMVALRHGAPVAYVQRTGPSRDRLRTSQRSQDVPDYVLVAGNLAEIPADYTAIPESQVLIIDRDLRVALHPL